MSSNTSPTGAQHQGEASQSETTVLSTPYGQPEGVRRQSVFQAAARAAAPRAHSAGTAAGVMSAEQSSTEEIEAVAPAAASEPVSSSEPTRKDASRTERTERTEVTAGTDRPSAVVPAPSSFPAVTSPEAESSREEPRRRRRWPLGVAAAALLLLGVVGAGGYAYAAHYDGRAVPGTTVAGDRGHH